MKSVRSAAPGRTEIAGNHTDHQGGRVIAAAVSCGVEMELTEAADGRARVDSRGFAPFAMDLSGSGPRAEERGATQALVRGVVDGLRKRGVDVGGFDAKVKSTVPAGSGLSSSAAFEVALAAGLVDLFGKGAQLGPVELALAGQAAERDYFGKPCGLMDQLAVAHGGIAAMDFADGELPRIDAIDFDFAAQGFALCLVDTHCDHSRYTGEYAQVAHDMSNVARFMGASRLREVDEAAFMDRIADIRAELGDLPALRGLHYYLEMHLVDARIEALKDRDMQAFMDYTRRSGASSAQYLQNVSCMGEREQPAMVALALCDALLGDEGACRIHGGGFGGSVQAFVPHDRLNYFKCGIDAQLGEGSCRAYQIDGVGK